MEENKNAAPLYVWVAALVIVATSAGSLLLFAGSVDDVINLIN
jgi:hypothetical protein